MPIMNFGNLPGDDATIPDLIDYIAMLKKTVDFLVNGGLDSANAREFGGWQIKSTQLMSLDSTVGMSSLVTAADDVRFWAGGTIPETAPFRVYESGKAYFSNIEISGGSIAWSTITGSPAIPVIPGYIKSTYIDSTNVISPNITGGVLTGGLIRTSAANPRIEMDTVKFGMYAPSGNQILGLSTIYNNGRLDFWDPGNSFKNCAIYAFNGLYMATFGSPAVPIYIDAGSSIISLDAATVYVNGHDVISEISGKAALSHVHAQSDVTGLSSALSSLISGLAGKSSSTHGHTVTIPTHNHGIPDDTILRKADGGTVTYKVYAGTTNSSSGPV